MTTSAAVRSAWNSSVWQHATVQALTPKIYDYDVTLESTKELSKMLHNQVVNCFTYLVTRAQRLRVMGQVEQTLKVEITYFREYDTAGTAWKACVDAFETIDARVVAGLSGTWGGVVDYYQLQSDAPNISLQQIGGRSVWVAKYTYQGIKNL